MEKLFLNPSFNYGVMTDSRDGKIYRTTVIGNQVWMAENLAYKPLDSNKQPSYGYNSDVIGELYSWSVAMGFNFRDDFYYEYRMQFPHQGICPEGWHIPSEEEFQQLLIIDASKLMASVGWDDYGLCGKHSDEYGFSALPIGGFQIYGSPHGYFDQSTTAYFWSTKQLGQEQTYVYVLRGSKGGCEANYIPLSKTDARAVRCVKD